MTITEKVSGANGSFEFTGVLNEERLNPHSPNARGFIAWAGDGMLDESDIKEIIGHVSGISQVSFVDGGFEILVPVKHKSTVAAKVALVCHHAGVLLDSLNASRKSKGHKPIEVRGGGDWDRRYVNRPSFHR